MKLTTLFCTLLSVFLIGSTQISAGELEDFEKQATKPKEEKKSKSSHGETTYRSKNRANANDNDSSFFDALFGILIGQTGSNSHYKAQSTFSEEEHRYLSIRNGGDPDVPFFQLAVSGGDLESDLQLNDYFAELGYGAVSLSYDYTSFTEHDPDSTVRVKTGLINFRMTFVDGVQVDAGLGNMTLEGSRETSDAAFSLRTQIMKKRGLGAEYRFVNTAGKTLNISDHRFNILYNFQYWSLRAGYVYLKSSSSHLQGPVLGISFQY